MVSQVFGLFDRVRSLKQGRGADGQDGFVEQFLRLQPLIDAPAVADRKIGVGHREIGQAHIGRNPGFHAVMRAMEFAELGRQPFGGETRRARYHDPSLAGGRLHDPPGLGNPLERFAHQRQAGLRRIGQQHGTPRSLEQGRPGIVFQLADLLRNRTRRNIEFVRRLCERQASCGGFKGAQGVQGRQAVVLI